MNERIKDLWKQAHEEQPPIRGQARLTKDILWGQPDKFNPEKFAKLIVKECLSIVEPTEDSGDEWCETLKGAAQEIKEHFGVEE